MPVISFNLWSVVILLGAAQGLFLSAYLLARPENRAANKWLAFLLVVISLHLLEYAADLSGITMQYPVLIAITYPLLFCIGPFYLLYCRCLLDRNFKPGFSTLPHFVPALLVLFFMFPFYTTPAAEKVEYISGLTDGDSLSIPAGQLLFMALHVVQTVAYTLLAYRFIRRREKELKEYSSDVHVLAKLEWLNSFNAFFAVYLLLYFVLLIVLTVVDAYQVQIDYIMLLIMSCSVFAVGYAAINNPAILSSLPGPHPEQPSQEQKEITPRNGDRHPEITEKLLHYMETGKPYLKSDLRISDLADALSVPSYQLSQTINDEFRVNFYDFINKYRVGEAQKLLSDNKHNFTILAIACDVGFNSKATFNRVFKKFTAITPSEFREKTMTGKK
jgi:AraC-like DNA-binding protein